tara:strand:+ start:2258 stop:3589 length:1332 start_codon:yes stop_codon:yes gene_type:complete
MGGYTGPNIVTDGLVFGYDIGAKRFNKSNPSPLLYDYNLWSVGDNASTAPWTEWIGAGCTRILATDPWGNDAVVWLSSTENENASRGGIYCSPISIDNTKKYRVAWWEKRVTNNSGTVGNYYLGCNGYGTVNGIGYMHTTGSSTNPYFFYCGYNDPILLTYDWFLIVAHIWPHDTLEGGTPGFSDEDSGIYDVTGASLDDIFYDFKFLPETTTFRPRTLAVYQGNVSGMEHHTVYPRFEVCDGNEPSLNELINNKTYQYSTSHTIDNVSRKKIGVNSELVFDGTVNSVIDLGNTQDLGNTFTVNVWVKANNFDSTYNPIIGRDGGVTGNFYIGFDDSANIKIIQYDGIVDSFQYGTYSVSTWYNISVTFDNKTSSIYVNGVKQGSSYVFTDNFIDTGNIKVGSYKPDAQYFDGEIPIVKIYSTLLTQSEITQNFESLRSRFGV